MSPAKKAASTRKAATSRTSGETTPADDAPEGVTTLGGARQGGRDPQPTDDPNDTVTLEGPGGTKVTAPTRMRAALKAQGFK